MIQELLPCQHRVLIIAKLGQRAFQEMRERSLCIGARYAKPEWTQRAEIIAKARLDQIEHILRDRIRHKAQRLRHHQVARGGFAVIMIEIPLPAYRLIAVHQNIGFAPHIAVEKLHAQRFAALGPVLEFFVTGDEAVIGQDLNGKGSVQTLQFLQQPPFARFCKPNRCRFVTRRNAEYFAHQRPAVVGVIQLCVFN